MVKGIRKPSKTQSNTMNSVLTENKTPPKSKQKINISYYQKNKEKLKSQRRDKYQQDREAEKAKRKQRYDKKRKQEQLTAKQQSAKYYGAEAFKVLMSFKEYTELNSKKRQLWLDFNWTLQDCQESIKEEGYADIVAIMKLEQVAGSLVRDYWETAKKEIRKGKSWNIISEEQQSKLIKYWGNEKARVENGYMDTAEQLEKQGKQYEKEIELAKFHEERGKIKCGCWQCEERAIIHKEVKSKIDKELKEIEKEQSKEVEIEWIKGECNGCGEYKKVDSDSGLCKKCSNS